MTTADKALYRKIYRTNKKSLSMLEQIRDDLIEMNRVWKELEKL